MNKKARVDRLIANSAGVFVEEDREDLMEWSDEKLAKAEDKLGTDPDAENRKKEAKAEAERLAGEEAKKNADKAAADKAAADKATADAAAQNAAQNTPKPYQFATTEEFLAAAPPALRSVLNQGIAAHNAEKQRLIGVITANKANVFSKEQLDAMELGQLQGLAALAASSTPAVPEGKAPPLFFGASGGPAQNAGQPAQNGALPEPLALPSWDAKA